MILVHHVNGLVSYQSPRKPDLSLRLFLYNVRSGATWESTRSRLAFRFEAHHPESGIPPILVRSWTGVQARKAFARVRTSAHKLEPFRCPNRTCTQPSFNVPNIPNLDRPLILPNNWYALVRIRLHGE